MGIGGGGRARDEDADLELSARRAPRAAGALPPSELLLRCGGSPGSTTALSGSGDDPSPDLRPDLAAKTLWSSESDASLSESLKNRGRLPSARPPPLPAILWLARELQKRCACLSSLVT